jgi:hypothetical protein
MRIEWTGTRVWARRWAAQCYGTIYYYLSEQEIGVRANGTITSRPTGEKFFGCRGMGTLESELPRDGSVYWGQLVTYRI